MSAKWAKWALSWLGLLVLALGGWALLTPPLAVEVGVVSEGRFERAVQEDGKTRVQARYLVSAPITGRMGRLLLSQGDTVAATEVLATLWPPVPALFDERTRAEQVAHSAALQAAWAKAQANTERATVALAQARAQRLRSEALAQKGFVSPSQDELERLNERLRDEERRSAQHEAAAAGYALAQSRAALRQFLGVRAAPHAPGFEVKAPVGGRVLKIYQQSEGLVAAGTPLFELGDPARLEVVVDVLSEAAAQIKPGMAVQLSQWGGPVLQGVVRRVEPAAFTKVSALGVEEQRVSAVIDITSPASDWQALGDGFKVDVRVLVEGVERARLVPVSAIFPMGGHAGMFVLKNGRAHLQPLTVRARNGTEAWVDTDWPVGTQVLVYPDKQLKDKDRVALR